jgi:hypothetical protein
MSDNRMEPCHLLGKEGERIKAILTGGGRNLKNSGELSFCLFLFWLFGVKIIGDMRLGHGIARTKLNDNVKSVWPGDG